jgi:hypothetical protein
LKKIFLIFIVLLIITGCRSTTETNEPQNYPKGSFQIAFQNTGEVILDDTHLELYEISNGRHILHLNSAGLAKIRSYIVWDTSHTPPWPSPAALYMKIFSVKFNGKELYSGKFFSAVSSQSYNGFVIQDVYLISTSDILTVDIGYPSSSFYTGTDLRENSELIKYLSALNKFKRTN